MPRTARLDAPGVLHHFMTRGIEHRNIFRDNKDREDFIARLEILCPEAPTTCKGISHTEPAKKLEMSLAGIGFSVGVETLSHKKREIYSLER